MKLNFRRGGAFSSKKAITYLEKKRPEDIQNIIIIRHAAIGDFVVMRPFLLEVRKFFPNAKITLNVLRNYMYGLPDDLVDDIFITDKYKVDAPNKKTSFIQRVKRVKELPKQDILFDLTDSSMSLLFTIFANVDLKIGYPYRAFRRFFYDLNILRSDFVLETMSMLHQLNILGANTQHYPLDYKVSQVQRDKKFPYIIYFAGASIKARFWGSENFTALIMKLKMEYKEYNHIILKGINKDEQFNEIYEPFKKELNVIHQDALPLSEIYDYLAGASLIIVGDTGIRNMAIAAGTPSVGIIFARGVSPHRYLPKVEEHQVVYNTEYTKPTPDDVYLKAQYIMKLQYENS
jgi:ADP-heptose:LPS heptosyltransferase